MFSLICSLALVASTGPRDLELISYHRLNVTERFDLSGIVRIDDEIRRRFNATGDYLLINDKTTDIYDAKIVGDLVEVRSLVDLSALGVPGPFDLEGIDSWKGGLFIVNEAQENFIVVSNPTREGIRVVDFRPKISQRFPAFHLSARFGLEGIGVFDGRVFLTKEKMPLAVFESNLDGSDLEIHEKTQLGSQTDIKIRTDAVYVLGREHRCIFKTQISFKTQEQCLSYGKVLQNPELDYLVRDSKGRHYAPWGNAEALEVEDNTFILGLDNNGESLKSRSETRPVIMVLK